MSVEETIKKALSELATSYYGLFVKLDGVPQPKTNFMGQALKEHVPLVVRALRAGDAVTMTARPYCEAPGIQEGIEALRSAMREAATCALYLDAKAGVQEDPALSTWAGCESRVALISAKAEAGVLSRALVLELYGQKDPNGHVWEPLQDALQTLQQAKADAALVRLVDGMLSFEDDNDLACVLGAAQSVLYDQAFDAETEVDKDAAAELAFKLYVAESQVMQSEHMVASAEELLDYEASDRLRRAGARGSSGVRMG